MNKNNNRNLFIIIISALPFLLGLTVLIGWWFDIPLLRKGHSGFTSMAPNSALCFMFSSLSIVILYISSAKKLPITSRILTLAVLTISILTFLESILKMNLGIDTLIISSSIASYDPREIVRMADLTAINFFLLSIMILFPKLRNEDLNLFLIAFPFFTSLLALAGYTYDVTALYSFGSFYNLSIYTAIGFLFLSLGTLFLCRDTNLLKIFYSNNAGGFLLRKLLPAALLLTICVQLLILYSVNYGLYSKAFGEAIQLVIEMIVLTILIVWNARKIMSIDTNLHEIQTQNQLLANIVASSTDAIIAIDLKGIITSWNKGAEQIYGYKAGEIVGKHIGIVVPDDKKNEIELLYSVVRSGKSKDHFETTRKRKDGKIIDVSVNISPIKDDKGNITGLSTIARDITDQKSTVYALKQSETRYKSIVETAQEGIWKGDLNGNIVYVNKRMADLLNTTPEEMVGKHFSEFLDEESIRTARKQLEKRKKGEGDIYELKFRKTNGEFFHALISSVPIFENGKVTGTLGMISDITKRKQAEEELKKMNAELETRVKERTSELTLMNKELETFTYSVSHDLRAPLRVIDGFSLAILEDYEDKLDDEGKHYLSRIRAGTQKMGVLIDDILRLSRITRNEVIRKKTDLSTIACNIAKALKNTSPKRSVSFKIKPEMCLNADSNLMSILLENLFSNSWKFTSKIPQAVIELGKFIENNETIYFVRDNGVGFDMKYAGKLFGAFQRMHTSKDYEGTGIGLATVYRIVEKHRGKVWAESEVNKGTTIFFIIN